LLTLLYYIPGYREPPRTVSEVLKGLQRCFSDPQDPPGRLGIDIRRKMLITDAMKEAKKKKFSPNKKLKVNIYVCINFTNR